MKNKSWQEFCYRDYKNGIKRRFYKIRDFLWNKSLDWKLKKSKKRIFSCKECGQVYYGEPPEHCMRFTLFDDGDEHDNIDGIECNGIEFKRIKKEDVINIHDILPFILRKWFKRLFK